MRKWLLPLILIFCLFLTGCSIDIKSLFVKKEDTPISNLPANALIFDGKVAHAKTMELISSAQKSIYLEQKIFSDQAIKDLIIKKATEGVEIRILLDQFETPNKATLNELKSNNISVQYYPAQKGQTNEVKLLIVDLREALFYSYPWTSDGFNSRNLAVNLTGRSVLKLANVFNRDWVFTTTLSLDIPNNSELQEDDILPAVNANVKKQVIENVKNSQQNIWAIVSHVTDADTVQAFIDAAGKGLDVKLIVDSKIMPGNWPDTLAGLKNAGVQIRYYDSSTNPALNQNLAIFDQKAFILSSSGWGYKSFVMNHEVSITVPSPTASQELIQLFDQDWLKSSTVPPIEKPKQ